MKVSNENIYNTAATSDDNSCFPWLVDCEKDDNDNDKSNADCSFMSVAILGTGPHASYQWAIHDNKKNSYQPLHFFRTRHVASHLESNDDDDSSLLTRSPRNSPRNSSPSPLFLADYWDESVLEWLGGPEFAARPTLFHLMKHRSLYRLPFFRVHVLLSSLISPAEQQTQFERLQAFLGPLPSVLERVQVRDFEAFPGFHQDLGVESLANLAGADACGGRGAATLVLDTSGPVWTWNATNTMGGGKTPSLGARFQTMGLFQQKQTDNTRDILDMCHVLLDTNDSLGHRPRATRQEEMVTGILQELALSLHSLIQGWVKQVPEKLTTTATARLEKTVIVTGRDAALVVKLLSRSTQDQHVSVKLVVQPHLVHWGMSRSLLQQQQHRRPNDNQFLGLRVVQYGSLQSRNLWRGTICQVKQTDHGEYEFLVHGDNGTKVWMDVMQVYGGLTLFASLGEDASYGGSIVVDRLKHQQRAGKASCILAQQIPDLVVRWEEWQDAQKKKRDQNDKTEKEPLVVETSPTSDEEGFLEGIFKEATKNKENPSPNDSESHGKMYKTGFSKKTKKHKANEKENKKRKLATTPQQQQQQPTSPLRSSQQKQLKAQSKNLSSISLESLASNPNSFVNRRVAKHFGTDLFYGTIVQYRIEKRFGPLWSIFYDDDDEEDMEAPELLQCLVEYEKQCANNKGNKKKRVKEEKK